MSIKLILTLLALSGIAGIVLGYVLRLLIALGQRGSLEIEVKQKLLEAKERANRIVTEAEERAGRLEREMAEPLREREEKLTNAIDRLAKREEFLDERERNLADESEEIRNRENEAANLKKEAEKLVMERRRELVRMGRFSEEEARALLMKDLEATEEEALLARIQKLETQGKRTLEEKARTLLVSAIHRLGSSVNADV
ncbi:MAG TPA: Rnase Y domain-containing protein, partial [Candidatus Paceibacterota bacterium]|nr:Rnase Y domain-containing protein [Candidatus Paceibacterota bacterium]